MRIATLRPPFTPVNARPIANRSARQSGCPAASRAQSIELVAVECALEIVSEHGVEQIAVADAVDFDRHRGGVDADHRDPALPAARQNVGLAAEADRRLAIPHVHVEVGRFGERLFHHGGRELWGFPKKLAQPTLRAEIDTLVGTLDYGPVRVATGTMGYKHKPADHAAIKASLEAPNFLLKIIPHVDGSPRICELVEYYHEDIDLKGAWTGPGALDLHAHALAPVAELPVLEILSATHIIADLMLGLGKVIYDYLR